MRRARVTSNEFVQSNECEVPARDGAALVAPVGLRGQRAMIPRLAFAALVVQLLAWWHVFALIGAP
jgi:hypothetical protein